MNKTLYLTLLVALVVALPSAHAASISGNLTPAATIAADAGFAPAIPGGTLLDVYLITANSDTAAKVTAFDIVFTGSFAQVQSASFGSNIPSPLLADIVGFGAVAVAQDTHLVPTLTIPGTSTPSEPAIGVGVPGSGFAAGLISDPVGILGAEQATSVVIAQIVMIAGGAGSFSGGIAIEGETSEIPVSGPIGIPEPGTFCLVAMGLVGMLASRRRLA